MTNVLLPIDLGHPDKAKEVLREGKALSEQRGASLTVIYVLSPVPGYVAAELPEGLAEKALDEAKTELEAVVNANGLSGAANIVVRRGIAQHEIVSLAKESNADLIVIGSHKPGVADYLLGSVAAAVVRHAPCSVHVLR